MSIEKLRRCFEKGIVMVVVASSAIRPFQCFLCREGMCCAPDTKSETSKTYMMALPSNRWCCIRDYIYFTETAGWVSANAVSDG